MKTAYEVLGLNRDAALIDIEHSYRLLLNAQAARDSERPLTTDDQRRLRELRQAYLVLSSPSQRLAYDRGLQVCEQRRCRRMDAMQTALAVLSLLGGLLLIGIGLHVRARHDGGAAVIASGSGTHRAIAQTVPASHRDRAIARR